MAQQSHQSSPLPFALFLPEPPQTYMLSHLNQNLKPAFGIGRVHCNVSAFDGLLRTICCQKRELSLTQRFHLLISFRFEVYSEANLPQAEAKKQEWLALALKYQCELPIL